MEVTSRHLRSATELQLLIRVRPGFVEGTERLTSYARRLQTLLQTLGEAGRVAAERDRLLTFGPIDTLQSIYATQWGVVERPEGSLLLISSSFDRSWEDYFNLLVDRTGALLDAIFMHCEGFAGFTCADGFERFAQFIRKNQVPNGFFYMAAPDLTVDDLRRARKLLQDGKAAHEPLGSVQEEAAALRKRRLREEPELAQRLRSTQLQSLQGLFALSRLFPEWEAFDERGLEGAPRSARRVFDDAVRSLLRGQLNSSQVLPAGPVRDWVTPLLEPAEPRVDEVEAVANARRKRLANVELSPEELAQIQGNIIQPYADMGDVHHGCAVLIQCDDAEAGARLLAQLRGQITSAAAAQDKRARYLNLSITCAGLERLGLSEAEVAALPKEFREGMEARAGLVGDVGYPNYPDFWRLPTVNWPPEQPSVERISLSSVDFVLTLHESHPEQPDDHLWSTRHPLCEPLRSLQIEEHGGRILYVQPLRKRPRGHFDMKEAPGVGQPVPCVSIAGQDLASHVPERDRVPLGELLLGYRDNRGLVAQAAEQHPELFKNGSFLVMRKLGQDVQAFEKLVADNMESASTSAETVKGWLLGRDAAGEPLTPAVRKNQSREDFDYQRDPGTGCPYHAHIRLANPRTPETASSTPSDLVPRIMRRSVSFGPGEGRVTTEECGLFFMAYNASIARQFEVIQRWLNAGNATGLASTQNDLLTGAPQPTYCARQVFHREQWRNVSPASRPLVTLDWGLYLFTPSLRAIDALIARARGDRLGADGRARPGQGAGAAAHDRALELIERLDRLPLERARDAWKLLIEGETTAEQLAVWAAIRARGGQHTATGYGTLVATREKAALVLGDHGRQFSVREYHRRLGSTIGEHYLAYDPQVGASSGSACPADRDRDLSYARNVRPGDYWQLSTSANAYFRSAAFDDVHALARTYADDYLLPNQPRQVSLVGLAKTVVARLAHALIGISEDPNKLAESLEHFILISRYSFQPYPDRQLEQAARAAGSALRATYDGYEGPMERALDRASPRSKVAALGAIVGFAAPAVASVLGVLGHWLRSGEFWRIALVLRGATPEARRELVLRKMLEVLLRMPVPPLLYRVAMPDNKLAAPAGELVVVGLGSVAADARGAQPASPSTDEPWLTGGVHGDEQQREPPHGCPARRPAFDMMAGLLEAVLSLPNVAPAGVLAIRFGT